MPHDDFVARVLRWAEPIAAKPRLAIRAAKRAIIDGMRLPLDEGLFLESRLFAECAADPTALELRQAVADMERDRSEPE
jgi:enoyl-CoA hydratase/carnithine racemase